MSTTLWKMACSAYTIWSRGWGGGKLLLVLRFFTGQKWAGFNADEKGPLGEKKGCQVGEGTQEAGAEPDCGEAASSTAQPEWMWHQPWGVTAEAEAASPRGFCFLDGENEAACLEGGGWEWGSGAAEVGKWNSQWRAESRLTSETPEIAGQCPALVTHTHRCSLAGQLTPEASPHVLGLGWNYPNKRRGSVLCFLVPLKVES